MKSKKSQIKIQETAFALLAIVILFSIVFIFYMKFSSVGLANKAEALKEDRALSMLNSIIAMPEISCSSSIGSQTESLCIDKDKLSAFKDMKGYAGFWAGLKGLRIMQIYPSESEFVIYPNQGNSKEVSTFASLCEQSREGYECSISMIIIAV